MGSPLSPSTAAAATTAVLSFRAARDSAGERAVLEDAHPGMALAMLEAEFADLAAPEARKGKPQDAWRDAFRALFERECARAGDDAGEARYRFSPLGQMAIFYCF